MAKTKKQSQANYRLKQTKEKKRVKDLILKYTCYDFDATDQLLTAIKKSMQYVVIDEFGDLRAKSPSAIDALEYLVIMLRQTVAADKQHKIDCLRHAERNNLNQSMAKIMEMDLG